MMRSRRLKETVAVYAKIQQYHETRQLESTQSAPIISDGKCIRDYIELEIAQSRWGCKAAISPLGKGSYSYELKIDFEVLEGRMPAGSCGVSIVCTQWSERNYVFIPAALYGGNRFEVMPLEYPPAVLEKRYFDENPPIRTTDIPHLSTTGEDSRVEQTTGDAACPCMGFWDPARRQGLFILTEQGNAMGNLGLTIEEFLSKERAVFTVFSPAVRSSRQTLCKKVPSTDQPARFESGDTLSIRLRIFEFACPRLADFFTAYTQLRNDLTGPAPLRHEFPLSRAFEIIEEKYNRLNWDEQGGYYRVGTQEQICFDWQLGWVGGAMATHPLLAIGSEQSRQRAVKNLETVLTKMQAPSGFFYGMGDAKRHSFDGPSWWSDGFLTPFPHNLHLIRKNADAIYFIIKQFMLMDNYLGFDPVPKAWREAVRRLCDAFVGLWIRHGQFGHYIDIESGHLLIGGSTAGAIASAGLALAAEYFNDDRYLAIATQSAKQYYLRDLENGLTLGGPGDILQAPDSESAFALLESFVVLYEMTEDTDWLVVAQEAARYCATWCVSYAYTFPADAPFAQLGINTAGSVFANAQNKHSAPGICTLSGGSLFKLFRATGDMIYMEMIRDLAHNITQYVSRTDRPIPASEHNFEGKAGYRETMLPVGCINERVNMSDWEGADMVGRIYNSSGWPEVSCMMSYADLPGLYIQTDTKSVFCIDHVEAEIIGVKSDEIKIKIKNPTPYSAKIRVFAETSEDAQKPLGPNAFVRLPAVHLEAGQEKLFTHKALDFFGHLQNNVNGGHLSVNP